MKMRAARVLLLAGLACAASGQSPSGTSNSTLTSTSTSSLTATVTMTSTTTSTMTPTMTPTMTQTTTGTSTLTPSNTATPSRTPSITPSATMTVTMTATISSTKSVGATSSVTGTETPSDTSTGSTTPSSTPTPTGTMTGTSSLTPSPSLSKGAPPSATPSASFVMPAPAFVNFSLSFPLNGASDLDSATVGGNLRLAIACSLNVAVANVIISEVTDINTTLTGSQLSAANNAVAASCASFLASTGGAHRRALSLRRARMALATYGVNASIAIEVTESAAAYLLAGQNTGSSASATQVAYGTAIASNVTALFTAPSGGYLAQWCTIASANLTGVSFTAASITLVANPAFIAGPPTPSPSPSTSSSSNTGAIVGGVIGGLAGVALIGLAVYFALPEINKRMKPKAPLVAAPTSAAAAATAPVSADAAAGTPPSSAGEDKGQFEMKNPMAASASK